LPGPRQCPRSGSRAGRPPAPRHGVRARGPHHLGHHRRAAVRFRGKAEGGSWYRPSMKIDAAKHPWLAEPETRAVMEALGEARFVGGAVRNALLGALVSDIDIAVPVPPEESLKRLEAAGIKVVPTGLDHGTVTAIKNGKVFEVTSLRRDVATDGR